jgi:hypothetical protein
MIASEVAAFGASVASPASAYRFLVIEALFKNASKRITLHRKIFRQANRSSFNMLASMAVLTITRKNPIERGRLIGLVVPTVGGTNSLSVPPKLC